MQLASHGVPRLAARGLLPKSSRGIHIPAFIRTPPGTASSGTVQKILQQSRSLVTRFFAHLTTPGTLHGSSQSLLTRPIHAAARGHRSIRNGLSLPVRMALSRPLQAPFFPRAPAIPRGITQVGLGTARNFSSTRPIFQNLAQNVPVTGRAFWEADWELKIRKEREMTIQKPIKHKSKKSGRKEMMKPKLESIVLQDKTNVTEQSIHNEEMDHYFPAPLVPNVMTYMLIPLAPTPTSRFPLHSLPPDCHPLLPLSTLADLHASYAVHTLRLSSLFARLDTANVWNRGVSCSAYSHGSAARDGEGACTILKIEFAGWTKAEVRGVIGESGTGWCVLEEQRLDDEDDETSSLFSERSSDMDTGDGEEHTNDVSAMMEEGIDPAQSFILPTLDFSSDFITATSSDLSASEIDFLDHADLDSFSDTDWDHCSHSSGSSEFGSAPSIHRQFDSPSLHQGRFGFSSDFASKATEAGPRETLF